MYNRIRHIITLKRPHIIFRQPFGRERVYLANPRLLLTMALKPVTSVAAEVAVPASTAWNVLAEAFADISSYSNSVRNSWAIGSQSQGIGTKRRCELHSRSGFIEEVITAWEPEQVLETEVKATSLRFAGARIRFELAQSGSNTNIVATAFLPTRFPWKKLIAKGHLTRWLREYVQALDKALAAANA